MALERRGRRGRGMGFRHKSWESRATLGCERNVCSLGVRWRYKGVTDASQNKSLGSGDATEIQLRAGGLERERREQSCLEAG